MDIKCKVVNLYKDKYDVYIGRAGKGKDGYFCNPIKINAECPICEQVHSEKGSTLECFKIYFYARLEAEQEFKEKIHNLKGKTLGCFCKPKECHGDIIVDYVNNCV